MTHLSDLSDVANAEEIDQCHKRGTKCVRRVTSRGHEWLTLTIHLSDVVLL